MNPLLGSGLTIGFFVPKNAGLKANRFSSVKESIKALFLVQSYKLVMSNLHKCRKFGAGSNDNSMHKAMCDNKETIYH